ncbi:putative membrane protein YeiH [Friedmanniella endophytica]|uniref:Putative membrane protein YeiH n=1 Tax=Microlunatus kandeliicorticis TaxID=1759536 RepID=A0A7W3IRS3_9ACTN|nr:hypothetical protein [Microlunatus kandeliicorticis]MBA8794046.1 putative membrane protein YeiH [Microlunatus kandeliicorticis]
MLTVIVAAVLSVAGGLVIARVTGQVGLVRRVERYLAIAEKLPPGDEKANLNATAVVLSRQLTRSTAERIHIGLTWFAVAGAPFCIFVIIEGVRAAPQGLVSAAPELLIRDLVAARSALGLSFLWLTSVAICGAWGQAVTRALLIPAAEWLRGRFRKADGG